MIGQADEFFIHQTIDTIDHVANSDFRFTDRLVFYAHENPGDKLLMFGLGAFPNTNTMDGYCLAYNKGVQYNVRFSRPLNTDRERMDCGPLHLEILEPLKKWRLILEDSGNEVSFDITFTARFDAFEHSPIFFRTNKFASWHQMHYQQSGTFEGWVSIGGEKFNANSWWGSRDRSWGVRGVIAGADQTLTRDEGLTLAWMTAQFPDSTLQNWCFKDFNQNKVLHIDGALTTDSGHGTPFVDWKYEVSRRDETGSVIELTNFLTTAEGTTMTLVAEKILTMYISGITFSDGEFYGKYRGKEFVEGDQFDFSDSKLDMASIQSWGTENLVRYSLDDGATVGAGIYETRNLFN